MDLLDRYLNAIRPLLPRATQEDILRELSEDIVSGMEEKEEELGRSLTEQEEAEVIKKRGYPVTVAARYGPAHFLIGPTLFPFYWLVLKISVVSALVVRTIVAIATILLSADPAGAIGTAVVGILYVLVPVFCWVTGAFALFEICQAKLPVKLKTCWNPQSLPAIHSSFRAVPRTNSVAEVIFGSAAVFWWQALPAAPYLALGPAARFLALGPVWTTLYWPILLLTVAGVIQSAVIVVHPYLTPARIRIRLLLQAGGLGILGVALHAGLWVVTAPSVSDPGKYSAVTGVVNQTLLYCLVGGLIVGGAQFVWECVKYSREASLHSRTPAPHAVQRF